jgi:hypothetical protein
MVRDTLYKDLTRSHIYYPYQTINGQHRIYLPICSPPYDVRLLTPFCRWEHWQRVKLNDLCRMILLVMASAFKLRSAGALWMLLQEFSTKPTLPHPPHELMILLFQEQNFHSVTPWLSPWWPLLMEIIGHFIEYKYLMGNLIMLPRVLNIERSA